MPLSAASVVVIGALSALFGGSVGKASFATYPLADTLAGIGPTGAEFGIRASMVASAQAYPRSTRFVEVKPTGRPIRRATSSSAR